MSAELDRAAELEKLARVLATEPDRLPESLATVAPSEIRALRRQIADTLLDADRRQFARVAALGKTIPTAIVAKLAERALGPMAIARAAGLTDPALACDIAERVSPDFLADIGVHLDPRHAAEAIGRLPADRISAAAAILDRRGEYAAMGIFVGYLSEPALAATVAALSDPALLRTGYLIESPERLDEIVRDLPDERIDAMASIAAGEDRWEEYLGIAEHLGGDGRERFHAAIERCGAEASLRAAAGRDPALDPAVVGARSGAAAA